LALNVLQHVDEEGTVTISPTEIRPGCKYPAVFRWNGDGADVSIAGSFNSWRSRVPMVKRLVNKLVNAFLLVF